MRLQEGPTVLVGGRLQSEPGVTFLGPKGLIFLDIWAQSSRLVLLNA